MAADPAQVVGPKQIADAALADGQDQPGHGQSWGQ
jgi:hypothetical protein